MGGVPSFAIACGEHAFDVGRSGFGNELEIASVVRLQLPFEYLGVGHVSDADLRHDFNGLRMDVAGRFRPGGEYLVDVAEGVAQDAFSHAASAGVASAEDGNLFLGHVCFRWR